MEFDKSRVYTALNADELKIGSKVIVADNLSELRHRVWKDKMPEKLSEVLSEHKLYRFIVSDTDYALAYLVSEPGKYWTDLKIGDIISNGSKRAMVTAIDSTDGDSVHIYIGYKWLADNELEAWEKVENENNN